MHSLAVYCGSGLGKDEQIVQAAQQLGRILADNNIRLVYGGTSVGIMGALADSCLAHGGQVVGVLPRFLQAKEIAHNHLTELHLVNSLHERKAMIVQLSAGFIALPGGIGTFEELFETWTLRQLGIHNHPLGLLNVQGYYDDLLRFLNNTHETGFISKAALNALYVDDNPHTLISKLLASPNMPLPDKLYNLEKS